MIPTEQIQTLTFKKLIMTIGNLPSSYVESLSYYECMLWLCNYLENTVIPAVNNNGEAVEELQGLFIELKTYVDNYFNNLDVQQEINNKLDEMAEDGSLTLLIKDYVDPIYQAYESDINAQINEIDTKVTSATSGSPKGVYATVSALTTADPDHDYIYVVTQDGKWYYYNTSDSSWTAGGTYQSSSDTLRIDHLQENVNEYGVTVNFTTAGGGGITSDLYLKGGKTYIITRLSNNDTVTGSMYIEGHSDYSVYIPYYATNPSYIEFSPVYDGYLRIYESSTTTGQTLSLHVKGKVDSLDEYINGYVIKSIGLQPIYVTEGEKIKLNIDSNTVATNLTISPYQGGDPYITLPTGSGKYFFTAYKTGYLSLQQSGTSISGKIFQLKGVVDELEDQTEYYIVDKNGSGDYTSFTEMEEDLANNFNNKVVYLYNGVYDILEELGGSEFLATIVNPGATSWRDVNKLVPPNTHIIGLGNATLKFAPTAEVIGSQDMAFLFSPLNISYSCTIENVNVEAKNCRYAIHDDSGGYSTYKNTIHKFINVRAKKEHGTYGGTQCFGSGLATNSYWEFNNCTFESDFGDIWSVHTSNSTSSDVSNIVFNNCVFAFLNTGMSAYSSIKFISGTFGAQQGVLNIVHINNCYCQGKIELAGDANATNRFQLTILKTDNTGIKIQSDLTNPYTPTVYE